MKKFMAILMTIVLALTSLSCVTAFAVDERSLLERQIISELKEINKDKTVALTSFHKLTDTTAVYTYTYFSEYCAPSSKPELTIIGKYKYRYADLNKAYYFANGTSYTLNTAYTNGMITDEQLDDIAVWYDFEEISDDDVFVKIRKEIVDKYDNTNPDDISFFNINYLDNGDILFAYRVEGRGDYCVMQDYIIGNYRYFIDLSDERFLYAKSEVNSIYEAYKNGIIDDSELDEIALTLSQYFTVYTIYPDVNGDGKIDVDDVTYAQKNIAYIGCSAPNRNIVIDMDNDGFLTILDVTIIQKYIAGIDF